LRFLRIYIRPDDTPSSATKCSSDDKPAFADLHPSVGVAKNHCNASFSLLRLLSGKKRSESWTHGVSLLRFPQSREPGFECHHLNQSMAAGTGAGIGDS
jgi:hypothetical protein